MPFKRFFKTVCAHYDVAVELRVQQLHRNQKFRRRPRRGEVRHLHLLGHGGAVLSFEGKFETTFDYPFQLFETGRLSKS